MRHLFRAGRPFCAFVFALAVVVIPASAQNPAGLRQVPPPDGPVVLYSAEYSRIRVVPIAGGLSHPWGLAFRRNGDILITERDKGTLRVVPGMGSSSNGPSWVFRTPTRGCSARG